MRCIFCWIKDDKANAAIEAGFLFPVLVTILCGMVDVGVGLVTNQKVINSSQIVADLLAREDDVSDSEYNDAIVAARMALQPYDTTSLGIDVAGIQFVGSSQQPTVIWRDLFNMEANDQVIIDSAGLGLEDEGVIAVTVRYNYSPYFSSFAVGDLVMEEVAYVRGRKGLFVTRDQEA